MEYDHELNELLQEAVDASLIENNSKAYGIARQCIDQGYDSLSDKQKWVYDHEVIPHFEKIQIQQDVNSRIQGMLD